MAPRDLDAEFGPAAEPGDLDPTHLRAIGERLKAVVRQIEGVAKAGRARDEKLETIETTVASISTEVTKLEADVKSIEEKVLTKEEVKEFKAELLERGRRKWLWDQVKLWGGWIFGGVALALTAHEPIGKFFGKIIRALL